jgi:hypothetical protein
MNPYMRTITSVLTICLFLLFACSEEPKTPVVLADEIVSAYQQHTSLSYDIAYRQKYFSGIDDTVKISAKIDLVREESDSVFGGHVWISADTIERYYDTEYTYYILHNKQSVTRYPKGEEFVITGNTVGEAIRIYFLNPDRLVTGVEDTASHSSWITSRAIKPSPRPPLNCAQSSVGKARRQIAYNKPL